ncbi:SDR family oxidoreductase [Nocardia fluminea]|uniref:SDR family oxidoreductase n=1 Tax=Nocardia fluminea TaxID=134984 RepID=UPI00382D851C
MTGASRLTDLVSPTLLTGRAVFVTGGGSGINYAIADAFASVGANVAICGRTPEKLDAAAETLRRHGTRILAAPADVRDAEALDAAVDLAATEFGGLDTVVAGAAGNFYAPAESISPNGFRTVVDIDLLGSFHTARAAFDHLKVSHGSILFVSAGQAYLSFSHQAHVGAAKAGIENLMANLALEWGRHGIRSNSIVPGPIEGTEGMKRLAEPVGTDAWTAAVPLGRFGRAEEIAAMAVVLSSPLASYITGARVVVDGGLGLSGLGALSRTIAEAVTASRTEKEASKP